MCRGANVPRAGHLRLGKRGLMHMRVGRPAAPHGPGPEQPLRLAADPSPRAALQLLEMPPVLLRRRSLPTGRVDAQMIALFLTGP